LYLWRSPVVILEPHLSNETSTLFGDPRSAAPLPGSPAPIRVGSLSMPHDYGRWLHDRQNIRPSRPHAPQHDPKEPLEATRHRSWTSPLQHSHLLAQREHLQRDFQATAKDNGKSGENCAECIDHKSAVTRCNDSVSRISVAGANY
jgi:hypothetical protein